MASSPTSPRVSFDRLVIATRESRLAVWQAGHVQARLAALCPQCRVELRPRTTRVDQMHTARLPLGGGQGPSVTAPRRALAAGRPLLVAAQRAHEVRAELTLEQILDMVIAIASINGETGYLTPILQSALDGLQPPRPVTPPPAKPRRAVRPTS